MKYQDTAMFDSILSTNSSGKFLKLWKYFFDEILITVFVTKLFISRIISIKSVDSM